MAWRWCKMCEVQVLSVVTATDHVLYRETRCVGRDSELLGGLCTSTTQLSSGTPVLSPLPAGIISRHNMHKRWLASGCGRPESPYEFQELSASKSERFSRW